MKISKLMLSLGVAAAATSMTALAHAQNASGTAQGQVTLGNGTLAQALPPSRSDNDAQPMVASPSIPAEGVVQQAGVGGTTAGRPGVPGAPGGGGESVRTRMKRRAAGHGARVATSTAAATRRAPGTSRSRP